MSLASRISALASRVGLEVKTKIDATHPGVARAWVCFGYVGTQVVVTTGRYKDYRAVVVSVPREAMHRPLIRLLADEQDHRIEPVDLDLGRDEAEVRGTIARSTDQAPVGAR